MVKKIPKVKIPDGIPQNIVGILVDVFLGDCPRGSVLEITPALCNSGTPMAIQVQRLSDRRHTTGADARCIINCNGPREFNYRSIAGAVCPTFIWVGYYISEPPTYKDLQLYTTEEE